MAKRRTNAECAATWVDRAIFIHKGKYGYSESEYVNARTKIKIRCYEHGFFYQWPHVHANGHGCPACKAEAISMANRKKPKDLIPIKSLVSPLAIMNKRKRDRVNT